MNYGNSNIVLSFRTFFREYDERPEKRNEGTKMPDEIKLRRAFGIVDFAICLGHQQDCRTVLFSITCGLFRRSGHLPVPWQVTHACARGGHQ